MEYDNKGNQTHRNGAQQVTYNRHNKPTHISRKGTDISLSYGADLQRYKQVRTVDGEQVTTHYIGNHYEVEYRNDGQTRKHYISDIAIVTDSDTQGPSIAYTHRDRLGSAVTMTDHNDQVVARRYFDAFGKPRVGDGGMPSSLGLKATLSSNTLDSNMATRRGFTDHEHLDEAELIHMNGRVYDYNLGRFMSVDPFIQSPGNSQSVNPYSYIMNNPLAGTDPTGYCAAETGTRIKSCVDVEVTNTDTGEVSSTSMNSRYSNFAGNVASFAASKLGNGAQITGMSATLKNGKTEDLMSQGSISKENVGKPDSGNMGGDRGKSDLSVTQNEWDALANEDLATLYKSRAMKDGNVGNVGLGVWGSFEDNVEVHGYFGAIYWNKIVGTLTTLNSYAALSDDAAYLPFTDGATVRTMMAHIHNKPMAIRIAQEHLNAVQQDFNNDRVGIRGLLSERQITSYHHKVFREFNANVGRYGGTLGHGELSRPMSNAIRDISTLFYCQPACDSN